MVLAPLSERMRQTASTGAEVANQRLLCGLPGNWIDGERGVYSHCELGWHDSAVAGVPAGAIVSIMLDSHQSPLASRVWSLGSVLWIMHRGGRRAAVLAAELLVEMNERVPDASSLWVCRVT